MINFGVREVANNKGSAAPGWAYVPDSGVNASVAALQPSGRKRARNQPATSQHETTAKQEAKILRELSALDRENYRDVSIPVPVRHRDNAGRVSHGKVTPAVRKILQSQKTFANHLSDFEALSALNSTGSAPSQSATPSIPVVRAAPDTAASRLTSKGTRSHKKKDPNVPAVATPLRRVSSISQVQAQTATAVRAEPKDTPMPDAPILSQGNCTIPASHPGDTDTLLVSRIPSMPSQEEIQKLLDEKPRTYAEARAPWVEEDRRKPIRQFCEICGYWGRVKCTRCGGRVCALECLRSHQEECFARYGA